MTRPLNIAILGATGAVGQELLHVLSRRALPIGTVRALASATSAGRVLEVGGTRHTVHEAEASSFDGIDVAFMSAGAARSLEWAPVAVERGALVVDNSSAFRMDDSVPLIVPEVNGQVLTRQHRLVANPNCCAAILAMALGPLERLSRIERVIVSTYQSASGGGAALMQDLESQTRDYLAGRPVEASVSPHPYAFNLYSHNTPLGEDGQNEEERKVEEEAQKILQRPDLKVNVTCVRVPILRAHAESVTIEFCGRAPSEDEARAALDCAGVRIVDDRISNRFPMPSEATGRDEVLVGRIRSDPSHPNALRLFIVGDQLLKGAALNAVQIAEHWMAL